ncbi:DUF4232 domain-containing protein [Streptomyces sp. NPDC021093]|uniref:DUF4232 domain-containing protein n=1 Tax=Streptomyces sp. NPDC021093 TaxID=3365112 RepID=UPI0037B7C7C0
MRPRTAPLAAAVLAVCLGLTACNDSSDDKGAGAKAGSSAPAPGQSSASSGTGSTGGTGSTDGSGEDTGADTGNGSGKNRKSGSKGSKNRKAGATSGNGASTQCTTAGLDFAVAPGSGAQAVDSQGGVTITLTNTGTAPCSLNGYPGVNLMSTPGDTWSLARQTAKKPQPVTLQPGAEGSFTITYLPFSAAGNSAKSEFKASKIVVTPPGETRSTSLPWTFQPVLRQDGATHPGTYVGPIETSSTAGKKPTKVRPPAPHKPRPAKRKTR